MKKTLLVVATALISTIAVAQKAKVSTAETSFMLQKFDDAKQNIDEALASEKSNTWPKTYTMAADIYGAMAAQGVLADGIDQAKAFIEKAIELDAVGEAGKNIGKYQKDINRSLERFANNSANAGVNCFNNNNYKGAKECFANVIWANSHQENYAEVNDSVFILNTALAAMQEEDWAYAATYFDKCVDVDYDGTLSCLRAHYCYQQLSDTASMEKILKKGFEKYPDNKDILANLIQHYLTTGQNEAALTYLNEAIAKDDSNALFYYARGCLNEKVEIEAAIKDYEKAIELDEKLFNALYNIAVVYFNQGIEVVNEASGERDNTKYQQLQNEAKELFGKSAPYFERAAECADTDDNRKYVYEQLKTIYYRLGDYTKSGYYADKAKEF